jgi:hypothetical protein
MGAPPRYYAPPPLPLLTRSGADFGAGLGCLAGGVTGVDGAEDAGAEDSGADTAGVVVAPDAGALSELDAALAVDPRLGARCGFEVCGWPRSAGSAALAYGAGTEATCTLETAIAGASFVEG